MDGKANIPTQTLARTLAVLQQADGPLTAAQIAEAVGHWPCCSHETQRRRVREVVDALREAGHWVVALGAEGYAVTRCRNVWSDYLSHRRIDAKRIFGQTYERKRAMWPDGQYALFGSQLATGGVA